MPQSVVIQGVGEGVVAIGEVAEQGARQAFGIGKQGVAVPLDLVRAVPGNKFLHPRDPALVSRELGVQVPRALGGRADIGQDHLPHRLVEFPCLDQFDGRDNETFLNDFAGDGHRTGGHPPHIRMMGAVGRETDENRGSGGWGEGMGNL